MSEAATKKLFAAFALASVLAGLAVHVLHDRLGIDEDTARLVSTAFLVVGIGDTLLLLFWDRLLKRRQ